MRAPKPTNLIPTYANMNHSKQKTLLRTSLYLRQNQCSLNANAETRRSYAKEPKTLREVQFGRFSRRFPYRESPDVFESEGRSECSQKTTYSKNRSCKPIEANIEATLNSPSSSVLTSGRHGRLPSKLLNSQKT